MRYVCLIYSSEEDDPEPGSDEMAAMYEQYAAFGRKWASQIIGGEQLMAVNSATAVRVRDGRTITTDGPYAETKEQLGGFYLIEAENLDRAIEIASEIPSASRGSIEVRPLVEFD